MLVGVEEAILITILALYIWMPSIVTLYDLDLFMVALVFLLEVAYEIYLWVSFCKKTKAMNNEVAPAEKKGVKLNNFDASMDDIGLEVASSTKRL